MQKILLRRRFFCVKINNDHALSKWKNMCYIQINNFRLFDKQNPANIIITPFVVTVYIFAIILKQFSNEPFEIRFLLTTC